MRLLLLAPALLWMTVPAPPEGGPEGAADRVAAAPDDWPWWRGPNRNGVADASRKPPLKWGAGENVVWKSPVPGRGHGSPAVAGDHVYLAAADESRETQSVLCYHRRTGELLWQTEVHRGGFVKGGNAKSSHASSTPACDGKRVFINFLNRGAVYTTALNREGRRLWQTKVSDYVLHQGFGSSPAVYGPLVLVSADNKGGGALAGLDRATGDVAWKVPRPKAPNYASPIVLRVAGRDQLLMTGCDLVSGFDPLSGRKLWEVKGSTTECVTSAVTDGKRVFTSGGYPKNHVSAVSAEGAGEVAWENGTRVYVPSMLAHGGHLYAVLDGGVAACWKGDTGKELWRARLGGTFSASPVLAGENILATNEAGQTVVFRATPGRYEEVGRNQLGQEVLASPAVCGGRIYQRVATREKGRRQETLYCLGSGG